MNAQMSRLELESPDCVGNMYRFLVDTLAFRYTNISWPSPSIILHSFISRPPLPPILKIRSFPYRDNWTYILSMNDTN